MWAEICKLRSFLLLLLFLTCFTRELQTHLTVRVQGNCNRQAVPYWPLWDWQWRDDREWGERDGEWCATGLEMGTLWLMASTLEPRVLGLPIDWTYAYPTETPKVAGGKVTFSNQEIHTVVGVWANRDNEHMMRISTKRPKWTLLTQQGPSEAFPVTRPNVTGLSEHLSKLLKSQGVRTYNKPFNTLRFLPVPCCFISYLINCWTL